jgi:hypothetical protein
MRKRAIGGSTEVVFSRWRKETQKKIKRTGREGQHLTKFGRVRKACATNRLWRLPGSRNEAGGLGVRKA